MKFEDDIQEDDKESEDPDESGVDADDSVDLQQCPHCHREIYEQAERCPHCGKYVSDEDSHTRKPLWIIIGVIVTLLAMTVIALTTW